MVLILDCWTRALVNFLQPCFQCVYYDDGLYSTDEYISCTNGTSVTAILGSATFLEFQVAGVNSDGSAISIFDLTSFEGNFTAVSTAAASQPRAGYDVMYHTHPNGVVFYFGVVDAQDAGEYRLSRTGEGQMG